MDAQRRRKRTAVPLAHRLASWVEEVEDASSDSPLTSAGRDLCVCLCVGVGVGVGVCVCVSVRLPYACACVRTHRSHPNHEILDGGLLAVLREDGDSEHSAILMVFEGLGFRLCVWVF
jgi:hypothetical protein